MRLSILFLVTTYNTWNIAFINSYIYLHYLTSINNLQDWHWLLIWVYFITACIQSWLYHYQHTTHRKLVDKFFKILFSTTPTLCILVTLLYWILLNDEALNMDYSFGLRFRGGAQHTFNSFIAILDLWFSNQILTKYCLISPLIFILFYEILVLIWYGVGLYWPYTFLASVSGSINGSINWLSTLAFMLGILFATTVIYILIYFIVVWRERVLAGRESVSRSRQASAEVPAVEEMPYETL